MDWAWRCGVMVLGGVPAIVGGGLFYHFFESWIAVFFWELVLVGLLGLIVIAGSKKTSPSH